MDGATLIITITRTQMMDGEIIFRKNPTSIMASI
jgi:hypothetical protein